MARISSVDAFRGITIVGMVLVNSPGGDEVYPWLRHSFWNGWSPADLIFPSFLVIMGMSLALSFRKQITDVAARRRTILKALKRSVTLFALGAISNAVLYDASQGYRIMGVLQRIALCYAACASLYFFVPSRWHAWILTLALVTYWSITGNDLDPRTNFVCRVDRSFLQGHMYSAVYDPEGLLSTLSAVATTLSGVIAGEYFLKSEDTRSPALTCVFFGGATVGVGLLWSRFLPLNKHLWTSSYATLTAGAALLSFGFLYWLMENRRIRTWALPFEMLGRNPLLSYVLAGVIYGALEFTHLKILVMHTFFGTWLPAREASAGYALLVLSLTWIAIAPLDRKRIYLRL